MRKYIMASALSLLSFWVCAQDFKFDNVRYQTISWTDFFKRLENNPKLVYYDIRSQGERSDTSRSLSFNQGKIKGAMETDFSDFKKFYPEYLKHKNDTIYLYCSHSRRSRLLAKQLADSSFVNVININGGLSYFNTLSKNRMPYKDKYYTSRLKYKLVAPPEFIEAFNSKTYQIVDVRPDSLYFGTSGDEWQNSFGSIENVLHLPYDKIKGNLKLLDKRKPILLFDNEGKTSPIAANYLVEAGYETNVLLFGLSNLVASTTSEERKFLETKYPMILPDELLDLSEENNIVIIDSRTEPEYTGTDKTGWKNIGSIKNAVNIPLTVVSEQEMTKYSGKTIVIYDMAMQEGLFKFAQRLKGYGINNFYLLTGGVSQLRSEIYNMHKTEFKRLLVE